jgi:glutamate/tyrosine decarboxylase-like PLP-dependent enzyme
MQSSVLPGRDRQAPLAMDAARFRAIGHALVDQIAASLDAIPGGPVTTDRTPAAVREALGLNAALPAEGTDAATLLSSTTRQLFEHSLFNAHPRFWGYITSSPAPIGILGDLLASALNPNVGAWTLSPAASEIEAQAVRWIAELVGYPTDCGGIFVSGGNMANFVCFLAARAARAGWDIRRDGLAASDRQLLVYASAETHTWIQKATDLAGLGTASIRWIPTDDRLRMDVTQLERRIDDDIAAGHVPFVVIGTAGSVSTGAVDPVAEIAQVCKARSIWFHVDGAYGAMGAAVADTPDDLRALGLADSVAVDPHKWLYAPLEAGCALVRDAAALRAAFSYHPAYYHFDEQGNTYVDYGPQNSRGFRALKVWLALKQVGANGYRRMIADDMALSRAMAAAVEREPDLQLVTQALSIATFRFVPSDLRSRVGESSTEEYLNRLNQTLLDAIQRGGEAFVSNALVRGRYVLRACIVNFHTTREDVEAIPEIVVRTGREIDARMRASAAV